MILYVVRVSLKIYLNLQKHKTNISVCTHNILDFRFIFYLFQLKRGCTSVRCLYCDNVYKVYI